MARKLRDGVVFNSRNFSKNKNLGESARLSTCIFCRHGVFEHKDDYIWANCDGYVHKSCYEEIYGTSSAA